MKKRNRSHIECLTALLTVPIVMSVLASCSTTSHLSEGEILYTGIDRISIEGRDSADNITEALALEEVNAALAFAPNNSFMGSSSARLPLPIGLWIYNGLLDNHGKGLPKWLFNNFASLPVTLESVAPETRVKVATNTLQNYGYFQGTVDYRLVEQKDPKKKKIEYNIHLGKPYTFDSIMYVFPEKIDSIRKASTGESLIHKGDQFNAANLQMDKERIVNDLRNNGYYYYRPDYISYYADSMMAPQKVNLLMVQDAQTPEIATRQWYNGRTSVYIRNSSLTSAPIGGNARSTYTDSLIYRNTTFYFSGRKSPISPRILMRNFRFRRGRPFSQERIDETVTNLSNMQIFSQMQFAFTPRDTTGLADTLDLRLNCTMDKLIDAEFDFDFTQKSNAQIGPRVALTVSKRNAFGHGETFSVKAKGSYEWQTKSINGQDRIDSYEAGVDASLKYPWLALPWLSTKRFRYATSSTFKVGFNHLKRAGYYRLVSFQTTADYTFRTNEYYSHRLTPLSLVYNKLEETTARFDSIANDNQSLFYSLRDQFIPSIAYSITYDNNWNDHLYFTTKAELTVKESGNLISGITSLFGSDFSQEDKKLINVPYAQFFKTTFDIRHLFKFRATNSLIATRFFCGAIWAYGNSYVPPYTEQFFVGGANDIRAFGAHAIGPGSYYDYTGRGTYLDQSGSLKLELNAEYRFPIVSNLHGALFLDAGNVWTLKNLSSHPGGQIRMSNLLDDIATGTGFGLRYNLDIIVLRLDMGIALHAPYDTGKSGYYNIRTFWKDGVGLHFAVGYPF